MILSAIKPDKVIVKCDVCSKEWESNKYSQKQGIINYGKDLCRGCKQREQIKLGIRGKQYKNTGVAFSKKYKGKKLEEIVGEKKAKELKIIHSNNSKGKNNANYGGKWHGIHPSITQLNKSYNEIYGIDKSNSIKNKLSKASSGENNPMFGKPSPIGSGNGWSGWYKGWFFRSLKELSFMINVIERFKFEWESGESKKYKISYTNNDGVKRNYFPDFVLNKKYIIEIKPKKLHKSINVVLKKNAALEFCKKNKFIYKLLAPIKTLSYDDILLLIKNNDLEFIDRYKEKFKLWQKVN